MREYIETERPRAWWVALLLSLGGRGVGQFYNRQYTRGIAFFALPIVLSVCLAFGPPQWMALPLLVMLFAVYPVCLIDAARGASRPSPPGVPGLHRWYTYGALIFLAVSVSAATTRLVVDRLWVPSLAMEPTIPQGDFILFDKLTYRFRGPARGEVVLLESPREDEPLLIKRVVGLPGETIEIHQKIVFVNGTALPAPAEYFSDGKDDKNIRDNLEAVTLGADLYFVLGDNRDDSLDSRQFGPVLRDQILARAGSVYFSAGKDGTRWDRLGLPIR